MIKKNTMTLALILSFCGTLATLRSIHAQSSAPASAGDQANTAAPSQQSPANQELPTPEDEEPPVKKKKYTPAASLGEALYLASREDTDTDAYLNQAKGMVGQSGMNFKTADAQGRTPLHWAVIGNIYADKKQSTAYADIAELLLAGGIDVNSEDVYGNTALDYQDMSSAEEMLEILLENEARHGDGKDESQQLNELLQRIKVAASSGDIQQVRSALKADLPLSTLLPIKLTTTVSSKESRVGDAVAAVVSAPILVDGTLLIAPGTKIEGTVMYSNRSANRFERSELVLGFTNLINPDGTKSRLALQVIEIDNAREKVESNRIIGVSYPNNALGQKKVSWGMRLIGAAFPAFGYTMEASTTIYGKKFNREIRYEPGTDMTLQVMLPAGLKVPADLKGFPTLTPSADLIKLVNAQPQRVETSKGEPLDVTNVLLIGSRERVEAAFGKAGWEEPKSLGVKSGLETFAAILFKQGYDRAPFSDLYLGGRGPDLTYQRQLNTFAKRNHIRLWKVGSYEGRDVWLGAATHDIGMGIDRSGVKPHWYHTVDTRVDEERTVVMNDLMFTGEMTGYSLVDRPEMPKQNRTPAGNARDTDGRMLVIEVK